MTHICVSKLTTIGSDNGLSPAPSHYLNQCWNIVNWTLRNKLQWKFNRNSNIFIQENALEIVVCEMGSFSTHPQCVKCHEMGILQNYACKNQYLNMTAKWITWTITGSLHWHYTIHGVYQCQLCTQSHCYFADIISNENGGILIKTSLQFIPNDPINNMPALV